MNELIRCAHCRCLFLPNPRVKNQSYCSLPGCQRARRAKWQREKMKTDPDYHDNQQRCRKQWAEANRSYWRDYRRTHPQYTLQNLILQRGRDRALRLAKMDVSDPALPVKPAAYYLIPQRCNLAKMDALTQKIFLIPAPYNDLAKKDSIAFCVHSGRSSIPKRQEVGICHG